MTVLQKSLPGMDSKSTISLGHLPAIVGRGSDCDVRLCDPWVSRLHCEINQIDGRLVIVDLESKHGTFVNKCRVQCADLVPGDTLSLGMTRFVVEEGGRTLRIVSWGRNDGQRLTRIAVATMMPAIGTAPPPGRRLPVHECGIWQILEIWKRETSKGSDHWRRAKTTARACTEDEGFDHAP